MISSTHLDRRHFLQTSAAVSLGLVAVGSEGRSHAEQLASANRDSTLASRRIYAAVKWDMVAIDGTPENKLRVLTDLGYDGVELISPSSLDSHELRAASERVGLPIHGVVDAKHWDIRLSSPDVAQRERGRAILEQALRDAKALGSSSVLLVPGRVSGPDETHDHVWQRSSEEIRKVLPLASKLGVQVLIENVWNGFCESPEQLRDYVDEFESPWVGIYFDIGNCRKFGPSQDWIRTLGPRIVKLDCKDWSDTKGFCPIGEGDVDWSAVRTALAEIEFTGWSTAEVEGGDRDRLADILARVHKVLNL